jgi:hypothetical protein
MFRYFLLGVIAQFFLLIMSPAVACPIRPPEGMTGVIVSEGLYVNGLPLSVLEVSGALSPAEFVRRTEEVWKAAGYETKRVNTGPWLVLSTLGADCMSALQLKASNGSYGFLSISRLNKSQPKNDRNLRRLIPAGLSTQSITESSDHGRLATTAVLETSKSPESLRDTWVRHLEQMQWEDLRNSRVQVGQAGDLAEKIVGRKGQHTISIVMWRQGKTQAVVNVSEGP